MQSKRWGKDNQRKLIGLLTKDITPQTTFACDKESVLASKTGSYLVAIAWNISKVQRELMFYLLKDICGADLWVSCIWLIECIFPQLTQWLPISELCSASGLFAIW